MKSKNIAYQEKLDHMRFLAACLIVMFHAIGTYFSSKPLGSDQIHVSHVFDLLLVGGTGVSLFMTLSGFLFAMIGKDKEISVWQFYRNRFLRIYPLFVVFIVLAFYLNPAENLSSLLCSLFLLQNHYGAVYINQFTEAAWTVAVECQFYLLFPFLLLFFRRYGYRYMVGLIFLAMCTRLAIYLANSSVYNIAYQSIFGRIDQFLIGMIFGFAYQRFKDYLSHPLVLVASLATLLGGAFCYNAIGGPSTSLNSSVWIYFHTLEGLVWAFVISAYNASVWRFPKIISKVLAFGGTLSFSMYLLQMFVLRSSKWFILQVCSPDQKNILFYNLLCQLHIHPFSAALFFGACIVLPVLLFGSVLTYFLIEKPFLDLRSPYTKTGDELVSDPTTAAGILLSEMASDETGVPHLPSRAKTG